MMLGSLLVGVHMSMTHGTMLAMMSAYIPNVHVPGLGRINGTAWSFTDLVFGTILAYSNLLAGRLADASAAQGLGALGCFGGGAAASALSMLVLALCIRFGDLGREELVVQRARR